VDDGDGVSVDAQVLEAGDLAVDRFKTCHGHYTYGKVVGKPREGWLPVEVMACEERRCYIEKSQNKKTP
jgi:hypothetical protein